MCREEAAGIIASQYSKPGSGALAAYEEQLNEVTNWLLIHTLDFTLIGFL